MARGAPLIGITCEAVHGKAGFRDYGLYCDHRYAEAIKEAGGHPVLLPIAHRRSVLKRYLEGIAGLVIVGGEDLDPRLYGERPARKTKIIFERRTRFEKWLYEKGKAHDLPLLAICYGMQLVNVLEGGSLIQDIRRSGRRKWDDHEGKATGRHGVRFVPGSRLHRIVRVRSASVPTEHHQAVGRLGKGFRAVAHTTDGIIEAIENPAMPRVIAVQWHPERNLASPTTRRIFRSFVRQCRDAEIDPL